VKKKEGVGRGITDNLNISQLFKNKNTGTWLAQSAEHVALDVRVMSSSPMLGIEHTFKNKRKKKE